MLNAASAAALLLVQAAPAASPPSATTPAAVSPVIVKGQKPSVTEDNQVVCHSEKVIGSLFPRQICATKAQLADRRFQDRQDLERGTALRPYDITKGLPTFP
jgi:hypothetical protein